MYFCLSQNPMYFNIKIPINQGVSNKIMPILIVFYAVLRVILNKKAKPRTDYASNRGFAHLERIYEDCLELELAYNAYRFKRNADNTVRGNDIPVITNINTA